VRLLDKPKHTIHNQCIFPNHPDDGLTDGDHGSVALVGTYRALLGIAQLLAS
jgi:hypothetical protein